MNFEIVHSNVPVTENSFTQHTMTLVQQYNNFACVSACLESIKKDWGDATFSHQDFVHKNLDLFNGGKSIEGSCDLQVLAEVCSRCNFDVKWIMSGALACDSINEALVAYVFWNGEEGQKHFVRVGESDGDTITIMNPQGASVEKIPKAWVQQAFIIKNK